MRLLHSKRDVSLRELWAAPSMGETPMPQMVLSGPSPMNGETRGGRLGVSVRRVKGFTLVEVLAALMLIAIVLPAVMKGISVATSVAGSVRTRSEAVGLAQAKLNEIMTTGDWESDGSGDFLPDHPDYQWSSTVTAWDGDEEGTGIELVRVRVTWVQRGSEKEVVLSTLARVPTSTN